MTTSTNSEAARATETGVAPEEWNEAFGDLDLDNDEPLHSTTSTQSQSSTLTAATATVGSDKLNIVQPLWFQHTDEQRATEQFAYDGKTRLREILNFRVDRQQLVHLDLLARCHHKLGHLPAALSFQQQIVSLRPSISNLLLLARMMAEMESRTSTAVDDTEQRQARAAVLMRCIELCPVHVSAWHELSLLFLSLAPSLSSDSSHSSSPSTPSHCCSRHSYLSCALLTFSLVADLTNFTISPQAHPSGDVPSLSTPLYSALLTSAQQHIAQLITQLPAVGGGHGGRGECMRCAGVCECWRGRLHRYACLPLASLFTAEKDAEQARVEGSKRAEKQRGRRKGSDADDSDGETAADVDQFDALNL